MFSMPHFHLPMLQRKKPKNILYRKLQLRETTPFQLKRNPKLSHTRDWWLLPQLRRYTHHFGGPGSADLKHVEPAQR